MDKNHKLINIYNINAGNVWLLSIKELMDLEDVVSKKYKEELEKIEEEGGLDPSSSRYFQLKESLGYLRKEIRIRLRG